MGNQIVTILSQASVHEAILAMINSDKFSDRHTYVGGSEVGGCAREVAWKKVDPERAKVKDPEAAGRMLAGQILENGIVQIVRASFGGVVRGTGRRQSELRHDVVPLRSHPDGKLSWKVEWVEGMQLAYLDEDGKECFSDMPPEGPGTLEVKTANSAVFRKYLKEGLPPRYRDQTQTEMGLSGTGWTLIVLVNRENLSQFVSFLSFFNGDHYQTCVDRSRLIISASEKVRAGAGDDALPDAEPERGWCSYCSLKDDCPAHAFREVDETGTKTLPEDLAIEAEVLAEEARELKPHADRYKVVADKFKSLLVDNGVMEAFGFYLQRNEGRSSVDTKRLESENPELYKALLKKGDPSYSLKPARAKKAGK